MSRVTIDYGIDLGTTNSCVAVLRGTQTEIIKNNEGQESTPSAVWINKKGKLYVGRRAKERLEDDGENAFSEFKLQMGTSYKYRFKSTGREMTPEELSAEVLKSLRADVQQRTGEEISAAVISVPAAFELPQCEATNKAARMAGLSSSPLIQEPVAAALAYGFQGENDRVFWLVYDFGGGTFDAAIIQVRDGVIQVVDHGGDNYLGGKLIDWAIVEKIFVPALKREFALSSFDRENPRWRSAFAKLKLHAEEAKIRLSRDTECEIIIDPLCQDEKGEWVCFEYELKREDIEPFIEPLVKRSVDICKRILSNRKLSPGDIEKVLLVGGPTLTPMFREILSANLGIPLDFSIDPLTVVARGAAIFAGTQKLDKGKVSVPSSDGQYVVNLEYEPIGAEEEPAIGGEVVGSTNKDMSDFTIEFVETKTQWRSGKIPLTAKGRFMTFLRAEKGRTNEFLIELRDSSGNICKVEPERIPYTIGLSITAQPLIHSIGVATADNRTEILLEKGAPLPARREKDFLTTVSVKRGRSGDLLRIPVVEGENRRRADRNRLIGTIVVSGNQVRRDIPVGSKVEVSIEIDESRMVSARAYIPILDEEYEEVIKLEMVQPDPEELASQIAHEKKRLKEFYAMAQELKEPEAQRILNQIKENRMIENVENSLAEAQKGTIDSANKCQNLLFELQEALDDAGDILRWAAITQKVKGLINAAEELVTQHGDRSTLQHFEQLKKEIEIALEMKDSDLMVRKMNELRELLFKVAIDSPIIWVAFFCQLALQLPHMKDQQLAEELVNRGKMAIEKQDLPTLQLVVKQLMKLLPKDKLRELLPEDNVEKIIEISKPPKGFESGIKKEEEEKK